MAVHVLLLRGINLAGRNRIAMAALRETLEGAGYENVRTHLQSGNVVLTSSAPLAQVARGCERAIEGEFGLEIAVVARTRAQLAAVLRRDPLGDAVDDPRRYVVTFLAEKLPRATVAKLEDAAAGREQLDVAGREVYSWHPDGLGRSKLAALLGSRRLGVTATARNWATVTRLHELAAEG